MKAIKENIRKYYKYVDTAWTQPVFTNYTTWGTVSADNYCTGSKQYPWQALDGKTSGGDTADFGSDGKTTVNWYWKFASTLKIEAITIFNRNTANQYGGATTYTIYGLLTNGTYEKIGDISLSATAWVSGTYTLSTPKLYEGLKIYCQGAKTYVGIGEVKLTAKTSTIIEATESDYDYYEDVDVYLLPLIGSKWYAIR